MLYVEPVKKRMKQSQGRGHAKETDGFSDAFFTSDAPVVGVACGLLS